MQNLIKSFRCTFLVLLILHFLGGDLLAQKVKINPDPVTGDTVSSILIIRCLQGSLRSAYYYCYLQKRGNDYELRLEISRGMSNPFTIADDRPLEFFLNNDTIYLYPKNYSESKSSISGLGVMNMFDKESKLEYRIELADIQKMRDGFFDKGKVYFYSEQELNGTELDDKGTYFKMEWQKKDKKPLNKKLNKRIERFLEET